MGAYVALLYIVSYSEKVWYIELHTILLKVRDYLNIVYIYVWKIIRVCVLLIVNDELVIYADDRYRTGLIYESYIFIRTTWFQTEVIFRPVHN